jgi:hypothetical protein
MPFTISWNAMMIAYATQNARRRTSRVRSTARSSPTAISTPMTASAV